VIDGPRYSETWGDPKHVNIPHQFSDLAPQGVFFSNFRNNGQTYTNAGFTAIVTGHYQAIDNHGAELPANPTLFQLWLKHSGLPNTSAWIITSKDKLQILSNSSHPDWQDQWMPSWNCGKKGKGRGAGYRKDKTTFHLAMKILEEDHPRLSLIAFREPDVSAHKGDMEGYVRGLKDTDSYVFKIWEFIQSDPVYQNKTALFITNDHGRHLDSVDSGFYDHGDDCDGCRHISLLLLGPDFKKGISISSAHEQIDIVPLIADLLGFTLPRTSARAGLKQAFVNIENY